MTLIANALSLGITIACLDWGIRVLADQRKLTMHAKVQRDRKAGR